MGKSLSHSKEKNFPTFFNVASPCDAKCVSKYNKSFRKIQALISERHFYLKGIKELFSSSIVKLMHWSTVLVSSDRIRKCWIMNFHLDSFIRREGNDAKVLMFTFPFINLLVNIYFISLLYLPEWFLQAILLYWWFPFPHFLFRYISFDLYIILFIIYVTLEGGKKITCSECRLRLVVMCVCTVLRICF